MPFICYSAYYLVRKNFVLAMPDLVDHGYSKSDLGLVMSWLAISYGISNFFMGNISDRIDTRKLMPLCLMGSAFISLVLGFADIVQYPLLFLSAIMAVNGCLQGAGWPASAKMIAHWFHPKERGQAMSVWNLSHNVGCGVLGPIAILALMLFADWQSKFYFPGMLACLVACFCLLLLKDKPADCCLPSPFPEWHSESDINRQKTSFLKTLHLFAQHCLKTPALWLLAFASACVYFVRYGVIDWALLYLTETRGFTFEASSWAFFAFEYAAIPGTLLCGYLSDHHFKSKRTPVNILFMSLVTTALILYWQSPDEHRTFTALSLISIGFLIYGPLMLIHVHIIDVVPLSFAATAAGFCGLFGHLIGATSANLFLGKILDLYHWDACFQLLIGASLVCIGLLLLLWLWETFHPNMGAFCSQSKSVVLPVRTKGTEH